MNSVLILVAVLLLLPDRQAEHGKEYRDAREHETRKDVYRQNLRFIHSKNRCLAPLEITLLPIWGHVPISPGVFFIVFSFASGPG